MTSRLKSGSGAPGFCLCGRLVCRWGAHGLDFPGGLDDSVFSDGPFVLRIANAAARSRARRRENLAPPFLPTRFDSCFSEKACGESLWYDNA